MRDVRKRVLTVLPVTEASRWSRVWWGILGLISLVEVGTANLIACAERKS